MGQKPKFGVLMSIYEKEEPQHLAQCLDSLAQQTLPADEWVIVEDGPLTRGLYDVLAHYEKRYPKLIKRVKMPNRVGLGTALAEGINHCSYELIARMDADDISCKDRFERQVDLFSSNPELDICGSWIGEFEDDVENIVSRRIVPVTERGIKEYQKRRDAFNHMTVMYKKQAVLDAGNYRPIPMMEDTVLWVHMLQNNAHCANIPICLVKARVGNDYYDRRGGWEYFKQYRNGKREVLKTGFINRKDYLTAVLAQLFVGMAPMEVRRLVYRRLLRKS